MGVKTMTVKCKCGNDVKITKEIKKHYYNWKCNDCGGIVTWNNVISVWKCSTPTVTRNSQNRY
jgi:hypothetical protein